MSSFGRKRSSSKTSHAPETARSGSEDNTPVTAGGFPAVAHALRRHVRQTDVLARVGGDEFAVLLPQTGAEHAETVAGGIVETLRQNVFAADERPIQVTASVGVALFDGLDTAELMSRADRAMYAAKAAGRDCFVVTPPAVSRNRHELGGRAAERFREPSRELHAPAGSRRSTSRPPGRPPIPSSPRSPRSR